MRQNIGRRTRIILAAVLAGAVAAALAGAAAAAWPGGQHRRPAAVLPHPSCGSAVTHFLTRNTQFLQAGHGALSCFTRAARTCRHGSIRVTEMGVDTGTDFVFAVAPGTTPCQVTEYSQSYSANFGGSHGSVRTVTCRRLTVTFRGVALRCGRQRVLIPARVNAPLG